MMYGWYGDGGIVGWVVMALMMLLFWGAVAAVVILLIRGGRPGMGGSYGPPHPPYSDPEQILNERFARGEIDANELNERRSVLRNKQ
ncbi:MULTISPECIES: SHOCT domain-containing protein [Arthrobacter]|uniref:SHOCT domain-containing protein n=1 Tax=Arthrobacter oryzae TaxID=409290 RepID=A0A3N0BRG3_9MICC|nr:MULTISPECIES: SHOCT domain-containing protein [Arthrobacter]QYF90559.1 SHOCT domain-containing protein [Arthrobacter sp. PAMC25284]RNL51646.1 SHOCT domain-containing protein [Arthrobacter oryzae]